MKKQFLFLTLCLLFSLWAHAGDRTGKTNLPNQSANHAANWEVCRKGEQVKIFQRWVEAEPGRKAREIYAELTVSAEASELAAIIRNEQFGTQWLSMADEYEVLRELPDHSWMAYARFNFMPLLKFDLVTRNVIEKDQDGKRITISIEGQPEYRPERSWYRRLSHFSGRWEFVSQAPKQTCVRYFIYSKTKPFLSRKITDPFMLGELEQCMLNVKKIAEK